MNYQRAKKILESEGQSQLLGYYEFLTESEREELLNDIAGIDFSVLKNIRARNTEPAGEITPPSVVTSEEIESNLARYEEAGLKLLKENKVAAVLLAGGQGTRLGSDKPKGMYDVGITRRLPIFGLQIENIKKVVSRTGVYFPLFVMTSKNNDADTRAFFKENGYFGYPADKVRFYIQNTQPACSFDGKIFLEKKHKVALSPNGNGGWYSSLVASGLGGVLKDEGIEWLNVYAVDNVLQRICDPAFVGATYLSGKNCSAKVVRKAYEDEKVGVLCNRNGKPDIIEYYDMPPRLNALRGEDGSLVFGYGVILNYLFKVSVLDEIVSGELPYHVVEKKIPHIENGVEVIPEAPNGYKFETLVVDMIRLMGNCLGYEVVREREFAPVKNRTGVDSVDTARELLKLNGVEL